jgi:hypothetical protein
MIEHKKAFPNVYDDIKNRTRMVYEGMDLRDFFASQEKTLPPDSWVQSVCGSCHNCFENLKGGDRANALAKWRYQVADAMIDERGAE